MPRCARETDAIVVTPSCPARRDASHERASTRMGTAIATAAAATRTSKVFE